MLKTMNTESPNRRHDGVTIHEEQFDEYVNSPYCKVTKAVKHVSGPRVSKSKLAYEVKPTVKLSEEEKYVKPESIPDQASRRGDRRKAPRANFKYTSGQE
jgi:hypothetical protein